MHSHTHAGVLGYAHGEYPLVNSQFLIYNYMGRG